MTNLGSRHRNLADKVFVAPCGRQSPQPNGLRTTPACVRIVWIALDVNDVGTAVLSTDELLRARRFSCEQYRRRFVAAHTGLRRVLSKCSDVAPLDIKLEPGLYGKPRLRGSDIDLRFNMSHSGGCAVVALSVGREVGVDVEEHRPIDVMSVAEYAFSPAECAALRYIDEIERVGAFYRCWTRKESFIKARGEGLSFPLSAFDVSLAPFGSQLLLACRAIPDDIHRWVTLPVPAGSGCSAAVTVEGSEGLVRHWPTLDSFLASTRSLDLSS